MGVVRIQNLAGHSLLERNLDGSSVRALKQAIAQEFCIPDLCQQLFFSSGTRALGDEERLGAHYASGEAAVSLTLVVSLEPVHRAMEAGGPSEREQALGTLIKLGPRGGGASFAVVSTGIEDENEFVRRMAVETLGQIAERGDADAIALASALLGDRSERVRLTACRALGRLAARGDGRALEAVAACLEADGALACTAVEVLAEVATDPVGAVVACLEHQGKAVRWAAVRALAHLSDHGDGDHRILYALAGSLEDEERAVRHVTIQALGNLARNHDSQVFEAVAARLGHQEWIVRCAVLQVVSSIAECGNEVAIVALVEGLEDQDKRVRMAALQALIQAGERGELQAAIAVGACLDHGDTALRLSALQAWSRLQQLVHERD